MASTSFAHNYYSLLSQRTIHSQPISVYPVRLSTRWNKRPARIAAQLGSTEITQSVVPSQSSSRRRRNGDGDEEWKRLNGKLSKLAEKEGTEAAISLLRNEANAGRAVCQNYNQIVTLLAADDQLDRGMEMAVEAGARGLANILTFRALMKKCCMEGDGPGAKRVWKAMVDCGVEGDMFLYAELMGALVRAHDLITAQRVITSLRQSGKRPHIVLYNTLLKGFAKKANVKKAFDVLRTIEQEGIAPDETVRCISCHDSSLHEPGLLRF